MPAVGAVTHSSPAAAALVRWAHRLLIGAILCAIAWFYIWTAWQGRRPHFGYPHVDLYYNNLTDGFLAGHLSLPTKPRPELKALQDPYSPQQNEGMRLHDASYYKGRYYLYFGVTPVVLLFLPFRALGVGDMPQNTAAALFMSAGLLFWFLTLSIVRRSYLPERGTGLLYAMLVTLGFGGGIPYLLRRVEMYEVAIACGFFCLAAAVYFLISTAFDPRARHWKAALASLFLGLAVGARPNLVFAAPFLSLVWIWKRSQGYQRLGRLATALVVPLCVVLFLLAAYNYARFGSPTEFGTTYQLAGLDVRLLVPDIKRIPFLSYFYLWHTCEVDEIFPYVHTTLAWVPPMPGFTGMEPVAGVFFLTPVLGVLALLPIVSASPGAEEVGDQQSLRTLSRLAWSLLAFAVFQVMFLSTRSGATMRYLPDFAGPFIVAAGVVLFALELRWKTVRWARWLMRALLIPLVVLTLFFNLGIGLTGYSDKLKATNPATYEAIKSATDPIATAIASFLRRVA